MANLGKIARLTADLRNEVCLRLYNGETSATILPWLNAQPEVAKVLTAHFDGAPITPQNLSEWKSGEYAKWIARREKVQNLKELSTYAAKLAAQSGNLASGGAAIIAGKVLEAIDEIEIDGANPETLSALVSAVSRLQAGEVSAQKLLNDKKRLEHDSVRLELEKEKFQRDTVELFITWAADERAKSIALSAEPQDVKMDKLLKLMYGDVAE